MDNLVEVNFKYLPFNVKFEHDGIEYTKTNFGRGFYWKGDKKIFRKFKKLTKVKTSAEHFEFIPLTK